ncbi:MAG: nuclear transport factor 2 family protein [Gemmatimonadota bacterium]
MLPILRLGALSVALGVCLPACPLAAQATRADSSAVVTAVEQFHAALTAGDSARAVALLAADVVVLESGAIQTRAEYLGHHLGADMKASKGSKAARSVVQVRVVGDAAYVVSKTATPATNADGSNGSEMAELMVLSKTASGWTIRAVHWSSRRRRA